MDIGIAPARGGFGGGLSLGLGLKRDRGRAILLVTEVSILCKHRVISELTEFRVLSRRTYVF
jgi:hypothetical protein